MPARAAPVCAMLGKPFRMSAAMLTIEPPCCSIDWVKTSRLTMKPPVRLLRTTTSKPLALIVGGGRGELAAGIVEQPVDAAVAGDDRGDRLLDLRFLADVEGVRLAACRRPPRSRPSPSASFSGLRPVITTCAPKRRDLVRGAAADAAAAAGHDHGLAVKQSRLEDRAIRHVSSALNGRSSACI